MADLAAGDVTAAHLAPRRAGVAVIASGGMGPGDAEGLVESLVRGWPAVVFRVPHGSGAVPVLPLEPVELRPPMAMRAVWQTSVRGSLAPGVVLPPITRGRIRSISRGVLDRRWRWVRAWAPVWEDSWE